MKKIRTLDDLKQTPIENILLINSGSESFRSKALADLSNLFPQSKITIITQYDAYETCLQDVRVNKVLLASGLPTLFRTLRELRTWPKQDLVAILHTNEMGGYEKLRLVSPLFRGKTRLSYTRDFEWEGPGWYTLPGQFWQLVRIRLIRLYNKLSAYLRPRSIHIFNVLRATPHTVLTGLRTSLAFCYLLMRFVLASVRRAITK